MTDPKPTASPAVHDPALAGRIRDALASQHGARVEVVGLAPLSGGACQESFRLDLRRDEAPAESLVLRGDARSSLPGSISRRAEFAVVSAAVAAGVRTPRAHWLLTGILGEGRDAWAMDRVRGEALGRRVVHDPRLASARERLPDDVAQLLLALGRVRPDHTELPLDRAPLADPAAVGLAELRRMTDSLPASRPGLELALAWLADHLPPPPDYCCLVHGDLRTGNLMVDEHGLVALLDWEFAHWGDPAEDLAWLCVRDWRFGRLDRAVGGWATRARMARAMVDAGLPAPNPARQRWWEVFGNLRWAVGSLYQGVRFLSGQADDIELLAIPLRVAEMEHEALRLLAAPLTSPVASPA
ncbi:MAG: phosphotransferase family protein [Alphaproteobacteria bacterium]|nr:phosphotransferase family protein [Alphaproteobacteria bacterium]